MCSELDYKALKAEFSLFYNFSANFHWNLEPPRESYWTEELAHNPVNKVIEPRIDKTTFSLLKHQGLLI